ncbi:MAG: ASPIC/UnbV domain-containing protein [Chloroflexi bacterium]|nr:ASPIC/UnbV domain-containing protein [Chloroflexota bacterium]
MERGQAVGAVEHRRVGELVQRVDARAGDQDVFVAMGGAYEGDLARNVLFENPGHGNRWLSLWLEGVESNRSAIGARVRVTIEVNGRERNIHRVVSSGSTFGGNPLRLDIGLGRAERVRSVTVHWPTTGRTRRSAPGGE